MITEETSYNIDIERNPKTDYTYSYSLSYRESVTPDRRIDSPNMSRMGLRALDTPTLMSPPFHDSLSLRSRNVARGGLGAFSDDSDAEESSKLTPRRTSARHTNRTRSSQIHSSSRSETSNLSYGLDVEGDNERTDDSSPQFVHRSVLQNAGHFAQSPDALNGGRQTANHVCSTSFSNKYGKTSQRSYYNEETTTRFKDYIKTISLSTWERLRTVPVFFVAVIMFCADATKRGFSLSKEACSNQFSSRRNLNGQKSNSVTKETTVTKTYTSTTVITNRQKLKLITEDLISWYSSERKRRPFLCTVIPLFSFLMGLLLLIVFLFGVDLGLRKYISSFASSLPSLNPFTDSAKSQLHSGWLVVSANIARFSEIAYEGISKGAFFCFEYVVIFVSMVASGVQILGEGFFELFRMVYSVFFKLFSFLMLPRQIEDESENEKSWLPEVNFMIGVEKFTEVFVLLRNFAYSGWVASVNLVSWLVTLLWVAMGFIASGFNWFVAYVMTALQYVVALPMQLYNFLAVFVVSLWSSLASSRPLPTISYPKGVVDEQYYLALMTETLDRKFGNFEANLEERNSKIVASLRSDFHTDVEKLNFRIGDFEQSSDSKLSALKYDVQNEKSLQSNLMTQLSEIQWILKSVLEKQNAFADSDIKFDQSISDLSVNIQALREQLDHLNTDHKLLRTEVSTCCRSVNASLSAETVRQHVSALLQDFLGLNSDELFDTKDILASPFGAWLASYFAAEEKTRLRLEELWVAVKKADDSEHSQNAQDLSEESIRQTSDLVMASVLAQLRDEMKLRMTDVASEIKLDVKQDREESEEQLRQIVSNLVSSRMEALSEEKLTKDTFVVSDGSFSIIPEKEINKLIESALLKYDADKTGMADHALESAGGTVVSTRCTEGYEVHQAELRLFGFSMYRYSTNTPRSVIQSETQPGQCYAFKGSQGFIVIQLASPVRVTGFTLEHIPRVLTPTGTIDSAPKDFSVSGLNTVIGEDEFDFGHYVYDSEGHTWQYFAVKNSSNEYFNYVELKITSNHGNMLYTCLYRFRVHGVRQL